MIASITIACNRAYDFTFNYPACQRTLGYLYMLLLESGTHDIAFLLEILSVDRTLLCNYFGIEPNLTPSVVIYFNPYTCGE